MAERAVKTRQENGASTGNGSKRFSGSTLRGNRHGAGIRANRPHPLPAPSGRTATGRHGIAAPFRKTEGGRMRHDTGKKIVSAETKGTRVA